ncbi:hypothetical protein M409DRAFT_51735 [Zasmidium cellare ATCC 36951]|uniref:Arrestin-like N-terminal domain-containing protein n=1 Tax=Zasmidium cellare ATCC 36951 TaxID=1080233 RepID=A0A6A6CUS6_ZASCE|nr:uncharacterized protein M409DRAFT_51735 [Zasmidium cellare ATCC 36951]KAF2169948.1 hypothetical protein M409DRAFT_51735 [Zasmidium cellare ATCC 36951]
MSFSSTSSIDGLTMPSRLRGLYQAQKSDIRINLNNRRSVYTTLDKIEGVVEITASVDTSFDSIDVEFVGTSRTYVERLTTAAAISGRSEAFHQFLKLQQPRMHQHYPDDYVLKAGETYKFPFLFVVPQQLLPRVCQHKVVSDSLREAHLQLPPSFGDRDAAPKAETPDDMVPDMASIRYGVFARISKNKEHGDDIVRTTVASKARRLRVLPVTDEMPPLDVSSDDSEYTMRKERSMRKGMLKGKLGTLVMEASQPPSMRLRAHSAGEQQPAMATIMLRFDPYEENCPPPRLGSLATKLKVCTFFASNARHGYPTKQASLLDLSQGLHTEQLSLSSRCVAGVEWTRHSGNDQVRRDSACSTSSTTMGQAPEASANFKGKSYYVARVLVPINLPSTKTFVPTFHSCLVSRIYQLKFELGLHTAGLGGTVDLKVPLQVAYEAGNGDSPRRGSIASGMEMEMDDEDVGDFFESRTVHIPDAQFTGRSRIGSHAPVQDDAPPGYSFFAPQANDSRVPVF